MEIHIEESENQLPSISNIPSKEQGKFAIPDGLPLCQEKSRNLGQKLWLVS